MQLGHFPLALLTVVPADSIPHIIPPSFLPPFSLPSLQLTVSESHSKHELFSSLVSAVFFSLSSLSFLLAPFLHLHTRPLPFFYPFMSARQLPPPFLLSIDFLLSFCSPLPSSTLSRFNIHPHFSLYTSLSQGFPSLHLYMSFVWSIYTIAISVVPSFSISAIFHPLAFLPIGPLSPTLPPCLLRGLTRH